MVLSRLTSATYLRGAYVGGAVALVALGCIAVLAVVTFGVPVGDVLLAAPGVLIGFGTLWYYFLGNPDPTLLMPNLVPVRDGIQVAAERHHRRIENEGAVVVEPEPRTSAGGPLRSFLTPWQVSWTAFPTELYLVFDVGNRGNQGVMLYEYRLRPLGPDAEADDTVVVSLSPETQALALGDEETRTASQSSDVDRAFVQPKERITEQVRLPITPTTDERRRYSYRLELYATSGRPVDSLRLQVVVDPDAGVVEWQADRSPLQRFVRRTLGGWS